MCFNRRIPNQAQIYEVLSKNLLDRHQGSIVNINELKLHFKWSAEYSLYVDPYENEGRMRSFQMGRKSNKRSLTNAQDGLVFDAQRTNVRSVADPADFNLMSQHVSNTRTETVQTKLNDSTCNDPNEMLYQKPDSTI